MEVTVTQSLADDTSFSTFFVAWLFLFQIDRLRPHFRLPLSPARFGVRMIVSLVCLLF